MNQHRSFLLILLLFGNFFSVTARSRNHEVKEGVTLLGSLVFPSDLSFVPSLTMLYKGTEYTIHDQGQPQSKRSSNACFELYDAQKHHTFYLVVTEDLQIPTSKNITNLETSPNSLYRVFKLQRVIHDDAVSGSKETEDLVTWEISETDNKTSSWKIPDNAIILFANPLFIDSLENVTWHSSQPIVRLPRIVFKKVVDPIAFKESTDKVQVALINFKFLHKKPSAQIVSYQSRTIAMPEWAGCVLA